MRQEGRDPLPDVILTKHAPGLQRVPIRHVDKAGRTRFAIGDMDRERVGMYGRIDTVVVHGRCPPVVLLRISEPAALAGLDAFNHRRG